MESTTIDVDFNPDSYNKVINVLYQVEVPKHSLVRWRLKVNKSLLYKYKIVNCKLYFEGKSAFKWSDNTIIIDSNNDHDIILAEGTAEETGNFKYGINVLILDPAPILYDEDPFLIVY